MTEQKTKLNDAGMDKPLSGSPPIKKKDLKGYREYAEKTRYRLFPWIW